MPPMNPSVIAGGMLFLRCSPLSLKFAQYAGLKVLIKSFSNPPPVIARTCRYSVVIISLFSEIIMLLMYPKYIFESIILSISMIALCKFISRNAVVVSMDFIYFIKAPGYFKITAFTSLSNDILSLVL